MAYKFQVGPARLSGSTTFEEAVTVASLDAGTGGITNAGAIAGATSIDGSGDLTMGTITMTGFSVDADGDTALKSLAVDDGSTIGCDSDTDLLTLSDGAIAYTGTLSGSGLLSPVGGINVAERFTVSSAGAVVANGSVTAGSSFIIGSADMSEADLEKLDGITNGTAVASKAMVLDSNKDISGARDITVDQDLAAGRHVSASAQLQGGAVAVDGSVTAGTSFIIGSADLNETDLEKLDGITDGTVAANKAVVVDSNKDASGFRNVSAATLSGSGAISGGSLVVGTADMSEADLEKLDGITDGTVAANKAVVVDSNKDATGFRDLLGLRNISSSAGLFSPAGGLNVAERFTVSSAGAVVAVGLNNSSGGVTNAGSIAGATSIDGSGDLTMGTITMTGFSVDADGDTALKSLAVDDGSTIGCDSDTDLLTLSDGALVVAGTLSGSGLLSPAGGINVAERFTVSTAGAVVAATVSGSGLFSPAGGLNVAERFTVSTAGAVVASTVSGSGTSQLHRLSVDRINVAGDDISDMTGDGLKLDSGALSVDLLDSSPGLAFNSGELGLSLNAVDGANIDVAADSIAFIDADGSNLTRKESVADLVSAMAGAGLAASAGVLSVSSNDVAAIVDGGSLSEGYNFMTGALPSGGISVTLPSGSAGDVVIVKAKDGTFDNSNKLTINRSGSQTIDGQTSVAIESPFGAVTCVYVTDNDWRIV